MGVQNPVRRDTPQGRADLDPMSPATARGQATAALGASGRPPVPKACSIAKVSEHCVREANGCGPGVGTSGKGTKASRPQVCSGQGRNGPGGNMVVWAPRPEGFRGRPKKGVTCVVARTPWSVAQAAPPSGQLGLALTCPAGAGTSSRVLQSPRGPARPRN